jgi:hypothetical protein
MTSPRRDEPGIVRIILTILFIAQPNIFFGMSKL